MLVDVAGNEISLPCHIDGRSEALAPWSSAAVQDLHPRLHPGALDCQPGSGVLDIAQALLVNL